MIHSRGQRVAIKCHETILLIFFWCKIPQFEIKRTFLPSEVARHDFVSFPFAIHKQAKPIKRKEMICFLSIILSYQVLYGTWHHNTIKWMEQKYNLELFEFVKVKPVKWANFGDSVHAFNCIEQLTTLYCASLILTNHLDKMNCGPDIQITRLYFSPFFFFLFSHF